MIIVSLKTTRTIAKILEPIHTYNKWTCSARVLQDNDLFETITEYGKTKDSVMIALMSKMVRLERNRIYKSE